MNHNTWEYLLQIEGLANARTEDNRPKRGVHKYFENRYFGSLTEAFESLVKTDLSEFGRDIQPPEEERYILKASIVNQHLQATVLAVVKISLEDSPERLPEPGIYLHFEIGIEPFERLSGISFKDFQDYDPGVPFLLLGRIESAVEYPVQLEPVYEDIAARIEEQEERHYFDHGPSRFKLHYREMDYENGLANINIDDFSATPALIYDSHFHYTDLAKALDDLLSLPDMRAMDPDIALMQGMGRYFEEVSISDYHPRLHLDCVSLNWRNNKRDESRMPGIYISFPDIAEFQEISKLSLTNLTGYNPEDSSTMIFKHGKVLFELMPTDWTKELIASLPQREVKDIPADNSLNIDSKSPHPYTVDLEWEMLPSANQEIPSSYQYTHRTLNFDNIEDAFISLLQVQPDLLDKDKAVECGFPVYISHAAIYDAEDNREVMSKFLITESKGDVPNGAYIKLDQEKLSLNILKATAGRIKEIEQAGSFHFLICRINSQVDNTDQNLLTRRRTHGSAKMISPENYRKGQGL